MKSNPKRLNMMPPKPSTEISLSWIRNDRMRHRKMGELGLLAPTVSAEYGGGNMDAVCSIVHLLRLGRIGDH